MVHGIEIKNMEKILYHGSDYNFNKFAFKNVGKKSGTSGAGFGLYFTTSKADALCYGNILYTVKATVRKTISLYKITFTRQLLSQMLRYFESISDNSYVEAWGDISQGINSLDYKNAFTTAINSLLEFNTSDVEIVNDIMQATSCEMYVLQMLKHFGYSNIIDTTTPNGKDPDGKKTENWIFYDTDCLKIIKKEKNLLESVDFENVPEMTRSRYNMLETSDVYQQMLQQDQNKGRAKSKSQRRLMYLALSYKRGNLPEKYASNIVKNLAKTIKEETLEDFAKTKQKKRKKDGTISKRNNIPERINDKTNK